MKKNKSEITIVGGGPVGLFLGICLSQQGIDCTILEKRAEPVQDSRSLGIHPVSLELFEKSGFVNEFLEKGISIIKGLAHDGDRILGSIDFDQFEGPFNFILACPQFYTERILLAKFQELNPDGLITEATVRRIKQSDQEVSCWYLKAGKENCIASKYIIGCDGKNSLVRKESGILYEGKQYPDTYIMGDFDDNTSYGNQAVVFLPKQGLIESFPLPDNMRRWVVKTDSYIDSPTPSILVELVQQRIGADLKGLKKTMISSFGVQNFSAENYFKDRVILCGDAAHVVSPIGGQGMNLGWIGAWLLAKALFKIKMNPEKETELLSDYQKQQKKIVKKASRRAEWNMIMGRKQLFPFLRTTMVQLILKTPLKKVALKIFTMKNLY
ncbi:MAG: FAD-dependent monooxygenase [Balneola sp.]|nr:FAD-dependent monooxygenase [Balneola sp.]MBO6652155.1 FAD-dependent monooxygenase [Balneola sp.]MBO6712742.1 FAD-dependent monooxygenase [Balneola sp.]MBO6801553.1 FAD-dependent monooxygenase [Balneola sp.]MBO6871915.1 FAD-dependent monooxygenase [Balneola sp.]